MGSCNCGVNVRGLHPEKGGIHELFWSSVHWLGFRNVAMLSSFAPGYSQTYFAAGQHVARSGNVDVATPTCAITLDDGIGEDAAHFAQLLELLRREKVSVTFFVIGDAWTTGDVGAKLLRQAVEDGHEIGNHGLADDGMNGMTEDEFDFAIDDWERRIRAILPQWPARAQDRKWFRAPKGIMSPTMADVLHRRGYRSVLGDIYSDDWAIEDAAFHTNVISNVTSDGSVIIIHAPTMPSRFQTLDILREAIPALRARGFRFARLTELFAGSNGKEPACSKCVTCGAGMLATAIPLLVLLVFAIAHKAYRCIRRLFVCGRAKQSKRQLELRGRSKAARTPRSDDTVPTTEDV